jgi:membrane protein YdbS with pleckstrin-like domain
MRNKKTLIVIRLTLLIIVALALLLFIATVIAALVLGLVYSASLPVGLKVGLVALLIVAVIAELELYRRLCLHSRRRLRIEIENELDFCDEMLESLGESRLTEAQRDVLRGTLESLLSETGKGEGGK